MPCVTEMSLRSLTMNQIIKEMKYLTYFSELQVRAVRRVRPELSKIKVVSGDFEVVWLFKSAILRGTTRSHTLELTPQRTAIADRATGICISLRLLRKPRTWPSHIYEADPPNSLRERFAEAIRKCTGSLYEVLEDPPNKWNRCVVKRLARIAGLRGAVVNGNNINNVTLEGVGKSARHDAAFIFVVCLHLALDKHLKNGRNAINVHVQLPWLSDHQYVIKVD